MTLILPEDFGNTPKRELKIPEGMTKLLMQVCCAPCCGAVLECFKYHNISPTLFFYNPNIHPRKEYEKRRDELIEMAKLLGFDYIIPTYDPKPWFAKTKGLEKEPERGARCSVCFGDRMLATAMYAKKHGFSHFTTTLATSRWKNKKQVDAAGFAAQEASGVPYWSEDWRKEGLVTRRYELVKSFNFYNQLYCGCIYSRDNGAYQKDAPQTIPSITSISAPVATEDANEALLANSNQSSNASCGCMDDCHC